MADFSEDEAQDARRIVERLLSREREMPDVEEGVSIVDVEADAAEFDAELQLLSDIGADFPAVRVREELVPIALSLLANGAPWPFSSSRARPYDRDVLRHPFIREWAYMYLRSFRDTDIFPGIERIPREQARDTFVRRATTFLATRISAVRSWRDHWNRSGWTAPSFLNMRQRIGGQIVPTPGCNLSVSTNTLGLRVFWSGAYRVSPSYFGHPTTPTVGVLQSGTYVFGVDGGAYGSNIEWDLNAVLTLPGTPHIHLNY